MRKAILWVLIAILALQGLALAETTILPAEAGASATAAVADAAGVEAVNGLDAARTAAEIYLVLPSGEGEMLIRLPLDGGQPVCMDRADSIDGVLNYGGGVAYLKTTDGSSAIMSCVGTRQSTLYSFGTATAEKLSLYGGKLLVLMNGLLHSVEPDSGVCLKLSGAQMLDYVVGEGYAYYLAGGDMMEYSAQLGNDETATTQAGCIYRLNLNNGETDLLLKSGGQDLKLLEHRIYFHNLADAYAVRTGESALLRGRVYGLDAQLKTLESACAEPDSGFWPTRSGVVAWYNGALNLNSAAGEISLYAPENGSVVDFDGEALYVWEPSKLVLTEVRPDGSQTALYSGDLTQATALALLPETTETVEPSATPESDAAPQENTDWFTNFMNNVDAANNGGSSSGGSSSTVQATPIGATPTPAPTPAPTPVPVNTAVAVSGGSTSSGSSASSTTYSTYGVSIDKLKITGAVNLRAKPLTSSTVYTSIPTGTVVSCTGTAAKTSGGSVWYQVKYNGTTGWIYSGYAKKYSSSSSDSSSTYSVDIDELKTTGDVNMRSSASLNASKKATIPSGTVVTCLGKAAKDSRGVVWYQVKYNGSTGWISSKYAKKASSSGSSGSSGSTAGDSYEISGKYVKIVGGNVNIRSTASTSGKVVGTMPNGAYGTCKGLASKDSRGVVWYKVSYDGVTGWVSSRYSKVTDSKDSSSGGSGSSKDSVKVVGGDVTIRAKADKTSAKLGYIAEGKTASYLGKTSTDSRGVQWYYISYNGIKGWISSMYSRLA